MLKLVKDGRAITSQTQYFTLQNAARQVQSNSSTFSFFIIGMFKFVYTFVLHLIRIKKKRIPRCLETKSPLVVFGPGNEQMFCERMFCEYCRAMSSIPEVFWSILQFCFWVYKLSAVKFQKEQKGHTRALKAVTAKQADSIVGTEAHR